MSFQPSRRHEFLDAGYGERTCRLDDGARILEHVLDGGADLVRIQQQNLVDMRATEIERLLSNTLHRNTIGENSDPIERHPLPRLEGFVHAGGIFRLDTDDPDVRIEVFHVDGDTGDQASAADRNEDRIDMATRLAQHLDTDRALSGDHVRIIERMNEDQIALPRERQRALERAVVIVSMNHNLPTEVDDRLHLDVRRRLRHHNDRRNAASFRGQRYALRMIAGRSAHDAALRGGFRQVRNPVIGAPQLERKHRLQILALQHHAVAEPARQARRLVQR